MTEPPVGAVGTPSSGVSKSRWARLRVHGDVSVHGPSRHFTLSRLNMVEEHTDNGACKTVGSPPPCRAFQRVTGMETAVQTLVSPVRQEHAEQV